MGGVNRTRTLKHSYITLRRGKAVLSLQKLDVGSAEISTSGFRAAYIRASEERGRLAHANPWPWNPFLRWTPNK
uniref:Uncharacterized protein n=1 Tax=Romanomermis culicivorax TaxID=13658 RepID=A0A915L6K9_ROMCU